MSGQKEVVRRAANRLWTRARIWDAHQAHPELSSVQLAQQLDLPTRRVAYALRLLRTAPLDLLKAYAHQAAIDWVGAVPLAAAKGDHKPARDLLLHTGQIQPVSTDRTPGVQIVFNSITVPGLHSFSGKDAPHENLNVLDVSSVNVTDASKNGPTPGPTVAMGPGAGPANQPENFSPKING